LHQNAFDLARILDMKPDFLNDSEHGHTEGVYSASFEVSRPIDMAKFQQWISTLLQEKGGDLLRTKGILHVAGEPRRFAFQAVHMMADGDYLETPADPAEKSRLVFIGRDLNRPQLRRGFEACQVAA
jgi:G3E family GTPase